MFMLITGSLGTVFIISPSEPMGEEGPGLHYFFAG